MLSARTITAGNFNREGERSQLDIFTGLATGAAVGIGGLFVLSKSYPQIFNGIAFHKDATPRALDSVKHAMLETQHALRSRFKHIRQSPLGFNKKTKQMEITALGKCFHIRVELECMILTKISNGS